MLFAIWSVTKFLDLTTGPVWFNTLKDWLPTLAISKIARMSLSNTVSMPDVWTGVGLTLGLSVILYTLVVWRVKQMDK